MSTAFAPHAETVRPEWVDYNGHMNVAYYLLAFDRATDSALDALGLGRTYAETCKRSLFVVEAHLSYLREVHVGERLAIRPRALAADGRRLHLFHQMTAADAGFLAATAEFLLLHVDLASRRSIPFDPASLARLEAAVATDAREPPPPQSGRGVTLRRRLDKGA